MFKANYTFAKAIDTFSDEGKFQVEHDQSRPYLNRAISDFNRTHRLVMSGTWDLPFKRQPREGGLVGERHRHDAVGAAVFHHRPDFERLPVRLAGPAAGHSSWAPRTRTW